MTSRERVREAVNHRPTDRLPVDLWATPEIEQRLEEYFGADSWEDVRRAVGVDMRWIVPEYIGPPLPTLENGTRANYFGIVVKDQKTAFGTYEETVRFPLRHATSVEDIEAFPMPDPDWFDYARVLEQIAEVDGDGEVWIGVGAGSFFERAWNLRGMEEFLVDLLADPEMACRLMDRLGEFYLEQTLRTLRAARGRVDMLYTADDLGTQRGLMISEDLFRQHILPRQKAFNEAIRGEFPELKIFYHSCGAIRPLIPGLIEEGVDILNPLQSRAAGMDPADLKETFGSALAFHGGVDVQGTLPHGTAGEVRAEVRRLMEILGAGGGYIVAPSHSIQADTPLENILALYEEATGARF